jgi:gliding motility-associated-like protein
MSKKIQFFTGLLVLLLLSNHSLYAQDTLFTIPDHVCAGTEIVPANIVADGQTYSWTFCPPQLQYEPEGAAYTGLNVNTGNAITVVQASGGVYVGFVANDDGSITRLSFPNGLNGVPVGASMGNIDNNMPLMPRGIQAVYDGSQWHLFVIGGTDFDHSSLARVDFANGLDHAPTGSFNLGNIDDVLNMPTQLYITQSNGSWFGFTFSNNGKIMVRFDFDTDLTAIPSATVLGNIDSKFNDISGITGIMENDNWYLFLTDNDSNAVYKLELGNNIANNSPILTDMGNFSNQINGPAGIAITKGCGEYYAYVLNNAGSGIAQIYWNGSINSAPASSILFGNVATMIQPSSLSQFTSQDGGLYLFTPNNDNSLSKIYYTPCDDASIASSDSMQPPAFTYDTAGVFTVSLTVDEGLPTVRTWCSNIIIDPAPPATYANDTTVCQGDTVTLFALSAGTDSFKWSPNYNIDTTGGRVVKVWPDYTTIYTSSIYYNASCYVKHPITVNVNKIAADAGPDRSMGDGSTTTIGGPNTTIGAQYTYNWWPDSFMVSPTNSNYATVRPEHDITYYLEVRDVAGCYAIDSVIVSVDCDDIHLPNAFAPQSPDARINTFGLLNLQLVKINYFKVFDRWGKEVFTTDDVHGRWDGKYKGDEVPEGVYIWEVDAFCNLTGERYKKTGSVTLLR